MQRDYRYELVQPVGRNFDPEFKPDLTPAEMLRLGVFGGKYMTDCANEFPASWFKYAKLASGSRDNSLNYFGVEASQPLSEWRRKGWIHPEMDVTADCLPTFDLATVFVRHSSPQVVAAVPLEPAARIDLHASLAICGAAEGSGRRFCIGPTAAANYEEKLGF